MSDPSFETEKSVKESQLSKLPGQALVPGGGQQVLGYLQWSHSGNKLLQQKVGAWLGSTTKINIQ